MQPHLSHSFVVRTLNSEATLASCVESIRQQSVPAEVVVVDSGSTDSTIELADRLADRVVHIDRQRFTHGRALNVGFEAAAGEIIHPLSSHCLLPRADHLELTESFHRDPLIVATNGQTIDPHGNLVSEPYIDHAWPGDGLFTRGFSNHSASMRRDIWQTVRFDEELRACEDKDWAHRVFALGRGYKIANSPELAVSIGHRFRASLPSAYDRGVREGEALQKILLPAPITNREVIESWWNLYADARWTTKMAMRVWPQRLAETAGIWRGVMSARRHR
jgi:rhamnosyltransferase